MAHTGCIDHYHGVQSDFDSNDAMVSFSTIVVVDHRSAGYAWFRLVNRRKMSLH